MKFAFLVFFCFSLTVLYSACVKEREDLKEDAKITLGHYLFFEKKLSFNQSKSCASCHSPAFAFSDGYRRSVASDGENLLHNAPSILNSGNNHFYDWDNQEIHSLNLQIKRPLYNAHPKEMGFDRKNAVMLAFLEKDSLYKSLCRHAFGDRDQKVTATDVEDCIVAYVKSLNAVDSKFDKFYHGDQTAFNSSEQNGWRLFSSKALQCTSCHRPPLFTLSNLNVNAESVYANIGLYNVHGTGTYPFEDPGLSKNTHNPDDAGKFKIPSLRNVLLTAPYMHDGSINTIEEVIDIYARGGRNVDYGKSAGDGRLNKHKHPLIKGFSISDQEKKDLIAFLSSLTDTTYLIDSHFLNPFSK